MIATKNNYFLFTSSLCLLLGHVHGKSYCIMWVWENVEILWIDTYCLTYFQRISHSPKHLLISVSTAWRNTGHNMFYFKYYDIEFCKIQCSHLLHIFSWPHDHKMIMLYFYNFNLYILWNDLLWSVSILST